jgi:propionyl-CoA carboxylase alpha chain
MRIAWNEREVREGFQSSKNEAASSFGDDRIFVEKFVTQPRHIEIQVLGDKHGNTLYLHERECSIQRRNQKVIEEAPSPFLDAATRKAMGEQAVALARAVGYYSAGTVEFIVDANRNFYFLEMNTRLQVEHPVTELITGLDLVEQMIRVAAGEKLSFGQADVALNGWAMESRLYAEDPYRNFLPSIGRLTRYRPPAESRTETAVVRNDTGVFEGGEISRFYDPMIAKLCTWGPDRSAAIEGMRNALDAFEVEGIGHNLPFVAAVMDHPRFISGAISTAFIAQEYPDGFHGAAVDDATLGRLAALSVALKLIRERRDAKVTGAMANHERRVSADWVVTAAGRSWAVQADDGTLHITPVDSPVLPDGFDFHSGHTHIVATDWTPGATVAHATVDGADMTVKVDPMTEGFRLRYRGGDWRFQVRTPRIAALAALMPEKLPPDTSKFLLCPMPGLVVSIAVGEGDEVQDGQTLAVIEAMKMENVLRAERKGTVKKINVAAGASLAVDQVIMEFE